jgi:hypothetical protein
MNKERIYRQWLHERRKVQVPEDLSDQIMARLDKYRPAFEVPLPPEPATDPWPDGLARVAAAIGLVGLGLFRLAFMSLSLLAH